MPPRFRFTREQIIQAALELTREGGMVATSYLEWSDQLINQFLTDAYLGMRHRFSEKAKKQTTVQRFPRLEYSGLSPILSKVQIHLCDSFQERKN